MAIELPGYNQIIANAVYAKHITTEGSSPEGNGQSHKVLIKAVLLPRRFTEATEDQVVEYFLEKIREVGGAASLILPNGQRPAEGKTELEVAIMALPDPMRRQIVSEEKDILGFVRLNTPAPAIKDGQSPNQYLFVKYGLIPESIISESERHGSMKDPRWYNTAFDDEKLRRQGLGQRWQMKVLLSNGNLPERADIDVLLKHGTHSSKTLDISRMNYDPKEVCEVTDAVYAGLSTPEQREELADVSEMVLEELTMQPALALHNYLQEQRASQQGRATR